MNSITKFAGLFLLTLTAAAGVAAPIDYSETSGDLSFSAHLGSLDVGDNKIQGHLCWVVLSTNPIVSSCQDSDNFRFDLPSHLAITNVSLDYSTRPDGGGSLFRAELTTALSEVVPMVDPLAQQTVDITASGSVDLYSSLFPYSGARGTLLLNHGMGLSCSPFPCGFQTDYIWTISVARVTQILEPTVLALFAIGLVGLGFSRRKSAG